MARKPKPPESANGQEVPKAETAKPQQDEIPQLGPGVYEKLDPQIYHRQHSFSRGDMLLADVPAKLKWHKDHPENPKTTPAKIVGNAFHTKLLEPDVFDARYTLSRYAEYRSNEAKAWRDEQTKAGLVVLSKEDWDMIDIMVISAREHPHFASIFRRSGMRRELTIVARDPSTGILLRARYDIVPHGNIIPDIKSTLYGSAEGFGKQSWELGYGFQAAHYLHVWNIAHPEQQRREFIFLVIEKEPPYLSAMYVTPHSLIQYCSNILRARRYVIAQCVKTGKWPGHPVMPLKESEFELPRYAVNEIKQASSATD